MRDVLLNPRVDSVTSFRPDAPIPRDRLVTSDALGDPPPGRSALDARLGHLQGARWLSPAKKPGFGGKYR
jgi:hypothetical protein